MHLAISRFTARFHDNNVERDFARATLADFRRTYLLVLLIGTLLMILNLFVELASLGADAAVAGVATRLVVVAFSAALASALQFLAPTEPRLTQAVLFAYNVLTPIPFLMRFAWLGELNTEYTFVQHASVIIFYVVAAVVGLMLLLWISAKKQLRGSAITGLAIALANAYALFLLVLFLGYGLAQVPRALWRRANRDAQLRLAHYKVGRAAERAAEAEAVVGHCLSQIKALSGAVSPTSPWRPLVGALIAACPAHELQRAAPGNAAAATAALPSVADDDGDVDVARLTHAGIVALHRRLQQALHARRRERCLKREWMARAYALEDVRQSLARNEPAVAWSDARALARPRLWRRAQLLYYKHAQRTWLMALAALCGVASLLLLWCELSLSLRAANVNLSVLALIVSNYESNDLLFFAGLIGVVAYLAHAAFSSLLSVRFFSFIALIPHQQTDSNSLLFSGAYFLRLAPPLAYNVLLLTGVNVGSTAFGALIGDMDVVPALGGAFSFYIPLACGLVALATLFNVADRIAVAFHMPRFSFDDRSIDSEHINSGASICRVEKANFGVGDDDDAAVSASDDSLGLLRRRIDDDDV